MSNYEAWSISHEMFDALSNNEQRLRFLVRYAVLAPSSHNSQPWSFQVRENRIDLIPDLSRALEISDRDHRQLHISMGAALQNLLTAADYFGYKTDVHYVLGRIAGTEEVRVLFSEHDEKKAWGDTRLIQAILERHTNREVYTSRLPDPTFLDYLRHESTEFVRIDLITDVPRKQALADITIRAGIEAMEDQGFRSELSRYLKNNKTRSPLGMPAFGMGIPTLLSFFIPLLMKFVNVNKLREKTDRMLLTVHTPALLVLSTPQDTPEYWIRTGESFERIALEATARGMHANPMAAAIQIGDFYKEIQGVLNLKEMRPQFFARLGFAKTASKHSPRLGAESVIR